MYQSGHSTLDIGYSQGKIELFKRKRRCVDLLTGSTSLFLEHYDLGPVLGSGGFAVVRLACDRKSGRQVAVKVFNVARFQLNIKICLYLNLLQNVLVFFRSWIRSDITKRIRACTAKFCACAR